MGCAAASERRAGAGRADVSSGASGTKQVEQSKDRGGGRTAQCFEQGEATALAGRVSSRVRVTASAGRA